MTDLTGKNILMTGGTGFIGRSLCRALIQEGASILLWTRKPALVEKNDKIFAFSDLGSIPIAEKIDIVINLAGESISQRWTSAAQQKIRNSRIDLTQHLVNFLSLRTQKPELFISGSAIGYYGTHENRRFTENTSPDKSAQDSFAAQLCQDWENAALGTQTENMRTVILRIGAVLEKDGGMLKKMHPAFYCGLGGPLGSGKQWLSWIHREDLIRLILFSIKNENMNGPVNATSPEPVTNKEFSQTLAKALHRPCLFAMPSPVAKILFGKMAEEIMLSGQNVHPEKASAAGFEFFYPKIKSALETIYSDLT